ncbi:AtpZ/AtpI family protein [Patescibacteria group bacterium]
MEEKPQTPWWEPALRIFAQVTGLIAAPIVLALFAGQALDRRYDSEPLFFIGLTIVAILFSTYSIVRIASKYMQDIEREAKNKDNDNRTHNK